MLQNFDASNSTRFPTNEHLVYSWTQNVPAVSYGGNSKYLQHKSKIKISYLTSFFLMQTTFDTFCDSVASNANTSKTHSTASFMMDRWRLSFARQFLLHAHMPCNLLLKCLIWYRKKFCDNSSCYSSSMLVLTVFVFLHPTKLIK
jgi:hypothetical protein